MIYVTEMFASGDCQQSAHDSYKMCLRNKQILKAQQKIKRNFKIFKHSNN